MSGDSTPTQFNIKTDYEVHDLSTFMGRLRHYAVVVNPMLSVTPTEEIHKAK